MKYSESEKQYHIQVGPEDVGEYVIMPGDPKRCEKIAAYLENPQFVADCREYMSYTGVLDGVKVGVVSSGIGGPSTAIAIEELVKCGVKTIIRIGTCGGIQPEVKSGDIVIAQGSVRMEGTSKEYAPIEWPAVSDFAVTNALYKAAHTLDVSSHVGVVQSKDSFYGQHSPEKSPVSYELIAKWKAWKQLGVLASEMESAALFTVAHALGIRAGACFLVMANQEREALGLPNPVVHDTDLAIRVAIEAMRELIREDKEK